MAEGLDRTIDRGCDEYFEFNCSVCLSKNSVFKEAAFYCPECNVFYCKTCLGQCDCVHNVLGRGSVDQWGQSSVPSQFDRCPKHRRNDIQLYCPPHDVVCCSICSQTEHKKCDDLKYIPLVASAVECKTDERLVKTNISQLKTKLQQLRQDRSPRLETINETSSKMMAEVKETRTLIDALLDTQEDTSIEEIKTWQACLTDRIVSELSICDSIETDTVALENKLDKSSSNEALLFSRIKQGKAVVSDNTDLISGLLEFTIADKVQFEFKTDIIELLKSHRGLGQVVTEGGTDKTKAHKAGPGQGHGGTDSYTKILKTHSLNYPYKVNFISEICVKMRGESTCNIWNMCQLTVTSIVVADNEHSCLKRLVFDYSYKLLGHRTLPGQPRGVCTTVDKELAVALSSKTIQFVSVQGKMVLTKCFPTKHECNGLAYVNKCLYVTEYRGRNVYKYDLSGHLLQTISVDQSGKPMFSNTKYITPSHDGSVLFVTDWERGLITISPDGEVLSTLNDTGIDKACDVCIDKDDNVFVCGHSSHSIIQVNHKGDQRVCEIAARRVVCHPQSLCFDKKQSCLLVASEMTNVIKVFCLSQ